MLTFLTSTFPNFHTKTVAQDTNDTIIHNMASLKTGLAFACELHNGDTKSAGHSYPKPKKYNILAFENKGLSQIAPIPPRWPTDESISYKQALHFAACARRIHMLASSTAAAKHCAHGAIEMGIEIVGIHSPNKELRPIEEGDASRIEKIWGHLSACDGIIGPALGVALEQGLDCTVSWLCSILVFGEQYTNKSRSSGHDTSMDSLHISPRQRHTNTLDTEKLLQSAPEVLNSLKNLQEDTSKECK